jgi:Concanavalin A-like lectin/glucanases superfamily
MLQLTGALSATSVLGAAAWPTAEAAGAAQTSQAGQAGPGGPSQPVPSLDELAGTWMPTATLLNLPSVHNFHGGLQVNPNIVSFSELTFPPLAQGGECCALTLNAVNVQAGQSRWYPYQVLRQAQFGGFTLQSAIRMGFEQETVLIAVEIMNDSPEPAQAAIEIELSGYLRQYPATAGTWQWAVPRPGPTFTEWTGQVTGNGQALLVSDSASPAVAAFAFAGQPDSLTAADNSGSALWDLRLGPREQRTIGLVMATGTSADAVLAAALGISQDFTGQFAAAQAGWEQRFADAFTPGNPHFSGNLPVLATSDRQLSLLYYASVASLLALERTSYPAFPRVYTSAGPQWGVTLTYFWDTSLFSPVLVMLDPEMVRAQVLQWLTLGIYDGYATDGLSGALVGPWYSANDLSIFTLLLDYVNLTGDMAFLNEQAGGMTVLAHMQAIALHWQQLEVASTGLADYGGESNLLEEVPNYVNQVPSLNGANVWMMRQAATLLQLQGQGSEAAQLLQLAQQQAGLVLGLYVDGQGIWQTVHDNGTKVPVAHVYDFDTIGRLMTGDLSQDMRSEMAAFVTGQLLAGGWMRALSESDPDAPISLRPDHGSNGAYDTWPALAASAMGRLGYPQQMISMLHTFSGVTAEGPFAQSHELVPEPLGVVVWDRDDLNPTSALTVESWISPAAWPSGTAAASIVAKDFWTPTSPTVSGFAYSPTVGYALRGGAGGTITFTVSIGGTFRSAVSTATVPTGGWHHVAGTFDGQQLIVYIDGNQVASAAVKGDGEAGGAIDPAAGTNLLVAADSFYPNDQFSGAVDEVRVYQRALSAAEIAAQYAAASPVVGADDPDLVLRLAMDEGHGQFTVDAVTGLEESVIAGTWVPGHFGGALSFTPSGTLTSRISRQQENEANGASFAATVLTDVFGYAPRCGRPTLRDPGTPRGISGSLHGLTCRGRRYVVTSGPGGLRLATVQPE